MRSGDKNEPRWRGFLIPPVNLVLPSPAVSSSPLPSINALTLYLLKAAASALLLFNDPLSLIVKSQYTNTRVQMFICWQWTARPSFGGNTWSYQHALSVPLSLSVCLILSLLQSLWGNLLGIAPLLSSPLPGCCCRLYSATTVCTQPGAPSNATSLAYTPHGSPIGMCVCTKHAHTHLVFDEGLSPLLCLFVVS